MKRIPVNTEAIKFVAATAPEPKTDQAGTQKTDRDGNPQFIVSLLAVIDGEDPEVLKVSTTKVGKLDALTPVAVTDLVAFAWAMGDRSGISFSASSVQPATAAKAA